MAELRQRLDWKVVFVTLVSAQRALVVCLRRGLQPLGGSQRLARGQAPREAGPEPQGGQNWMGEE